jgi:hypothetical protein
MTASFCYVFLAHRQKDLEKITLISTFCSNFLSAEGKMRDKIRNETLREEVGIENLLTNLHRKGLQLFGCVKGRDRTRILRRAFKFKFKFKEKRTMGQLKTR